MNISNSKCVAANAISFSLTVISAIILVIYMMAGRMSSNDFVGGMVIVGCVSLVSLIIILVLKKKKMKVDALGYIAFVFDFALILFSIFMMII